MRKYCIVLAVFAIFGYMPANAESVGSTFDSTTGVLELTNLHLGDAIYYVRLVLVDAETLRFEADPASVVVITPEPERLIIARAEDVVGTWRATDGIDISYTFGADRTFSMTQGPGLEDACPDGGSEHGIFLWTPGTAVFRSIIPLSMDENGDCGTNPPTGLIRIFTDGNTIRVFKGTESSIVLVRDE